VRANGSKDTAVVKARVVAAYGGELKAPKAKRSKSAKDKTKPLSISIATETLERAPDPVLQQFAAWGKLTKLAGTDLPVLRAPIVHTSFGLADTLRTTSRKPNIQNWGKKSGVRGCFDPRPGNVFIIVDYSAIEAATFAQIQLDLFGDSQIAEFYNQGAAADMHSRTGAGIRGCSYDEFLARKKEPEFDAVRQAAKIAIFTRFGGGGPNAIEHGARNTYRVYKTLEEWTTIVKAIDSAWPEIPRYHSYISRVLPKRTTGVDEETGKKIVKRRTWIPGTKLFRPSCGYCDACNTPFQSLAALITGEATYQIERAVWRRELPVGTLVDNVVHDEIVAEAPEAAAEEAKARIETIMVEVGRQLAPKLLIRVEGKIARKWSK
jgi:DNA polymerase I-like protein with 3'-5' exonuclease and polymerase domains